MKTEEKQYGREWFAEKLARYIEVRHPDIIRVKRLVAGRSRTAYGVFRRALETGRNLPTALGEADRILYHGLIFSRFDTV